MFVDDLVQSEGRVVSLVIGFLKKAGRDGVPTYKRLMSQCAMVFGSEFKYLDDRHPNVFRIVEERP